MRPLHPRVRIVLARLCPILLLAADQPPTAPPEGTQNQELKAIDAWIGTQAVSIVTAVESGRISRTALDMERWHPDGWEAFRQQFREAFPNQSTRDHWHKMQIALDREATEAGLVRYTTRQTRERIRRIRPPDSVLYDGWKVTLVPWSVNDRSSQPTTADTAETKRPARVIAAVRERKWYEGGTLHNATMAQRRQATYENRLATAADFVVTFLSGRGVNAAAIAILGPDLLRPAADNLVMSLDRLSLNPAYANQTVANMAAAVYVLGEANR